MKKYIVNVVSTMSDFVSVYADSEEEAISKAKYGMSKVLEYMNYENDYFTYEYGDNTMTAEYIRDDEVCCICGNGNPNNNAAPVADGYCCDECNSKYVIPYRIQKIFENRRAKQEK